MRSDIITRLFDVIIPSVAESEAVRDGYDMIFGLDDHFPKSIQNNKVFRLCQCLRRDQRTLDFHKCILDIAHREILFNEYGIE